MTVNKKTLFPNDLGELWMRIGFVVSTSQKVEQHTDNSKTNNQIPVFEIIKQFDAYLM